MHACKRAFCSQWNILLHSTTYVCTSSPTLCTWRAGNIIRMCNNLIVTNGTNTCFTPPNSLGQIHNVVFWTFINSAAQWTVCSHRLVRTEECIAATTHADDSVIIVLCVDGLDLSTPLTDVLGWSASEEFLLAALATDNAAACTFASSPTIARRVARGRTEDTSNASSSFVHRRCVWT